MSEPSFSLGETPFYWRMLGSPEADRLGIPDFLPFGFSFNPELQLVTQSRNPQVVEWLHRVYRENANVGYLQEGHALSLPYGDEFLTFLDRLLGRGAPVRSVMDIGCGGMYLLKILKDRGLEACGVDPSPVAKQCAERFGIELFQDFYPAPRITRKVDLLYHHNVLEHVPDPAGFLRGHHANLNEGGLVVAAVPDCTEAIDRGDISMMLHEHLVYFDADSLARTLAAAGFRVLEIGRSRYGGVLYGAGQAIEAPRPAAAQTRDTAKFLRFRDKATLALESFRRWMTARSGALADTGFYVPLRAIPYLAACGITRGIRFFDDDPGVHGKYFAGIAAPVENFEDLKARPVRHLVVCSYAFGGKITAKIRQHLGPAIETILLQDLVSPRAAPTAAA